MFLPALILLLCAPQDPPEVPMKPVEEFKLELEYKFKQRPAADNAFIDLLETESERDKRRDTTPLPYLIIHISFQTLTDKEVRIRCIDNNRKTRLTKKLEKNKAYKVDLGFTEDMKDRITSYEYIFYLMSDDRKDTSTVILRIEEDGTFLVNGIKRGKF
jgi:hypothetical protein